MDPDHDRVRGGALPSIREQRDAYALWMANLCRERGLLDLARSYEIEADRFLPVEERARNLRRYAA